MLRLITDRLERLEAMFGGSDEGAGPQVIYISGGLPGAEQFAQAGPLNFVRDVGEDTDAFIDRCWTAAFCAGQPFLIVGGLPPMPWPNAAA
jgi:hypothetical protein